MKDSISHGEDCELEPIPDRQIGLLPLGFNVLVTVPLVYLTIPLI